MRVGAGAASREKEEEGTDGEVGPGEVRVDDVLVELEDLIVRDDALVREVVDPLASPTCSALLYANTTDGK